MAEMDAPRKPRIALMGEFSAGKSTLSNLLMGERPLPEKVTATRLSPVWITYGNDAPYRVDMDGTTEPISIERLEDVVVGARTHRLDRALDRGERGHDDDGRCGLGDDP